MTRQKESCPKWSQMAESQPKNQCSSPHFPPFRLRPGALDAQTVHVIPKHKMGDTIVRRVPPTATGRTPFEPTFRLRCLLPRQQLHVLRVTPAATVAQVREQVCRDKGLRPEEYVVRHPGELIYSTRTDTECCCACGRPQGLPGPAHEPGMYRTHYKCCSF